MNSECVFVFVVCGAREHIDSLHYSLAALKKTTRYKVLVVTDSTRNEIPIEYEHLIDVKTPTNYNNHQASIYLKTGLYQHVPSGKLYCYLDTDVVALSPEVDTIFEQYATPITFAPDHCVADQFSLSAIKCSCEEKFAAWQFELKSLFAQHKDLVREPENAAKKELLEKKLQELKTDKLYYQWVSLKFNLSSRVFKLDEDNYLDKRNNVWVDRNGQPVLYENNIQGAVDLIESTSPYRMQKTDHKRWSREGLDVFDPRCTHLHEAIKAEFGIHVNINNWQHWNGGVFLFDDSSTKFLSAWHEKTCHVFSRPNWKTRDQGTLIATAWEFGLQNHTMLPRKYNLIADYGHKNISHLGNLLFKFEDGEQVEPLFIHVYHHWADSNWDVWKLVEQKTKIAIDANASTFNSLWIGNQLTKLELLTIKSFLAFGFRFRLWLYEPLLHDLPDGVLIGDANEIISAEKIFRYKNQSQFGHGKGSVAGFSDIFRYKMLYDFGGWWVDMDITCLQNLYTDKAYFFRKHHHLNVVGNVLKTPKGCELMKLCYEEAITQIDEHNTDWHKPIDILNKHILALNLTDYIVDGRGNTDQWNDTGAYVYTDKPISPEWWFIHWQNEEWRNQRLDKNEFPHGSTLTNLLVRYELYQPPKSVWEIWQNEFLFSSPMRKLKRLYFRLTSLR